LNAITAARPNEFVEATTHPSPKPNAEEVASNKQRWQEKSDSPETGPGASPAT